MEHPSISYLNINSLRNKITDLKQVISEIQPTILTISESKLDDTFPNAQFLIEGYCNPKEFRKDNRSTSGGMVTFIKSGTPCKRLQEYEASSSEIMCIELNVQGTRWAIISVYRPPYPENLNLFFQNLTTCLEKLLTKYEHLLIMGDMNINILEENTPGKNVLDTVADAFDLHHLHNSITCVKSFQGTSIDVLMTNKPTYFIHSLTVETGISDFHKMIIAFLKSKIIKNKPKIITYRKMKNFNTDNFLSDFNKLNFDYDEATDDPDRIGDDFCYQMQNILNKHAPVKKRTVRGNNAAFVNKELRKAIMKRSQLRNKHNKIKSEET